MGGGLLWNNLSVVASHTAQEPKRYTMSIPYTGVTTLYDL